MESEVDDTLSVKRRKTESENKDESTIVENSSSENCDTFLQDFLNKKIQNDLPLFQRVTKHEEVEAKERDAAEDLKLYQNACADFADCVMDVAEIKATKPEGWKEQISDIRKEAAFITLIMKKLNRVEKTRTKISREKVNKGRHEVDVAQLRLDNLFCEMQHLKREIDKCLQFRSRPLGIDLIPLQEFLEKSQISPSKTEIAKVDDHELQLARLEWELKQRKELANLLKELEDKKSLVTDQLEKKEKDLNSLGPLIKEVLVVTQPLQDKLSISPDKTSEISDHVSLLPEPLYFLYIQAAAYSDACDNHLSLDIKGSISEARLVKSSTFLEIKSSDEETELEEVAKESYKKESLEVERKRLFTKHPLSVVLKVSLKDGSRLDLQFYYYMHLHIVTVTPTLNVKMSSVSSSSQGLLNHVTLLSNLFHGDAGTDSPNLKNYYQLKKVGLDSFNYEKFGIPYVWAQKLGGLNFIGSDARLEPKQNVSRANMPIIIKELKRRGQYRLSLLSLIADLERGDVMAPKHMRSIQLCCLLKSWKGMSWTEIAENSSLSHIKNSCYVSPNDIFFKGIVSQAEAKLNIYVAVKSDYPLSPSIVFMEMDWKNKKWTSKNNAVFMDMEREVNIHWKELLTSRIEASSLLSYQIFKTMVCFDIFLESIEPDQFSANKNFLHLHRRRNRSLPFRFLLEDSLFVQRN